MHVTLSDIFTGSNLILGLIIYRKASIIAYQHKLMWIAFAEKRGISPKANGASAGSV